jgi:hypothetical protein
VSAREPRRSAPRTATSRRCGRVCPARPRHCGVDLPLKQEVDELLRCALAQLDVKSRDDFAISAIGSRTSDAEMEGARPIFSGATSLRWNSWALRRTAAAEANVCSSIGRLPSKVRELRQLALAVESARRRAPARASTPPWSGRAA